MSITIYDNREDPDPSIPIDTYCRCLEKAASILRFPSADVEISLVDDRTIQELNLRFRQIDAPTNVLAFPFYSWKQPHQSESPLPEPGPDDPPCMLGEIVVSLQTITREAESFGMSFDEQFMQMAIHGMLHLVGYDHETDAGEELMLEQTELALRACRDFLFRG